ncbi:lipase 3-like [Uranotaenia lowii]|uniref:lipase 3-like n=1 Tax=Uranotaenia lowii TaxID=190385 RepID=UPI002479D0A0|nr:lipase 3-like [Uranotaenia lowii]
MLLIRAALAAFSFRAVSCDFFVDEEDGRLRSPEITSKYGYRTETHKVETYDGFKVEMHRISASPTAGPFDPEKPPVFLMHGLMGSSGDWIMIGPKNALPYLLADRGYDVWMGNGRGNRYSNEHSYLTDNMREYWEFSWHEVGIYDMPVMIDFVLDMRKVKQLHYVGHSQGITVFLVLTSLMPQYNEKFIKVHALAPAAYLYHLKNPVLRYLATHLSAVENTVNFLGWNQYAPNPPWVLNVAHMFCPHSVRNCVNLMFLLSAGEFQHLLPKIVPVLLGHIPAGASAKQIYHFGQGVISGRFRQYDYGLDNNTEIYHNPDPPEYNLTNVRAPVLIYYGQDDHLSTPTDVGRLAQELPNVVSLNQVADASFGHMDFLLAPDVKAVLYDHIIASIAEN